MVTSALRLSAGLAFAVAPPALPIAHETCSVERMVEAPLIADFTPGKDGAAVELDHCDWEIVTANWGGRTPEGDYSGGVIAENVKVDSSGLVLSANGNTYEGPLRGRDSDGTLRADGKRTGAAIKSKRMFRGGRFEACVTIPPVLGVVTALWTFRYEDVPGAAPLNHEIDIEFPGQRDPETAVDLDHVNLTTWTGLGEGGHTTVHRALSSRASDGNFHLLRFDWTPPAHNTEGRVDFYIDDQLYATITSTVPSLAGQLWFGLWFPPVWAGTPEFDQVQMRVKWVRAGLPLDPDAQPRNDLVCK